MSTKHDRAERRKFLNSLMTSCGCWRSHELSSVLYESMSVERDNAVDVPSQLEYVVIYVEHS